MVLDRRGTAKLYPSGSRTHSPPRHATDFVSRFGHSNFAGVQEPQSFRASSCSPLTTSPRRILLSGVEHVGRQSSTKEASMQSVSAVQVTSRSSKSGRISAYFLLPSSHCLSCAGTHAGQHSRTRGPWGHSSHSKPSQSAEAGSTFTHSGQQFPGFFRRTEPFRQDCTGQECGSHGVGSVWLPLEPELFVSG